MPQQLPSHFVDLVEDALLKSFWRKRALLVFLRRHKIAENFLATWHESESKRDFLVRLFPKLERHEKGVLVLTRIADSLAEQIKFPDLDGWEDSAAKIDAAKEAVGSLKSYIAAQAQKSEDARSRQEARKAAQHRIETAIEAKQTLEKLTARLAELSKKLGTQEAGYKFQNWFYDLVQFFEVPCRRPYVANGRQIDGSVTLEGTTYLTELKFTKEQADAPDVDTFLAKVNDKADNTMGIMVSMSGYSSTAIRQASGPKKPLILMDYSHIYMILRGDWRFDEVVTRLRRHASQTGEAFLATGDFGG